MPTEDTAKARLLVDLDDQVPLLDSAGNLQYYCPQCHSRFAVNALGQIVP